MIEEAQIRLIVHLREEGGPYYKTYYFKAKDEEYEDRKRMIEDLKNYLGWKLEELKL